MIKKASKKAVKGVEIAIEHKGKLSFVIIVISIIACWYFWADIVTFFRDDIPRIWNTFYQGIVDNWFTIGLTIFAYKFTLLVVSNLSKRFIINRSVDRFKKSLIYSELDELIHISAGIATDNFKRKVKELEQIPFVGKMIALFINTISAIIALVVAIYTLVKTGLFKYFLGKIFSAQFWNFILMFVMNIPGFFIITGLIIWIWLENHIPWIPRFYYWVSMKVRFILDPIWDSIVVPISEEVANWLMVVEEKVFKPIGDWLDNLEMKIIHRLQEYIYYQRGDRNYKRYMRLVRIHNAKQLREKKQKEKEMRVRQFGINRRRIQSLREMKKKKEEKEKTRAKSS